MCLILFAHQAHPRYPLVVAANRDEFHGRDAEPAHWWAERPAVLAGRDRVAGGTWMGVNRAGHFAAVTNFRTRGGPQPELRSRGELPLRVLHDNELAAAIADDADAYNGFSLILRNADGCEALSNRAARRQSVPPGVHGLSNDALDADWPKVRDGRAGIEALLGTEHIDAEALLALLADRHPAPDDTLPDTGVGIELERRLSATFILGPQYGTRSSTALLIDVDGTVDYVERRFDASGSETGTTALRYRIVTAT